MRNNGEIREKKDIEKERSNREERELEIREKKDIEKERSNGEERE